MSADRSNYRVQVSRMMSLPFPDYAFLLGWNFSHIRTTRSYAQLCLLMRNSERFSSQSSLHYPWREFVSPASAPPLLRTIKLRLVLACLEISLQ
jgi:hypothetical protein